MTKEYLDHPRAVSGARVRAYAQIERQNGDEAAHPAIKGLHRAPATAGGRLKPYTRIERGRTA
ncbi:hypothetical protein ACXN5S_03330 [Pseudoroseicyclus sp. H15]